MRKFRFTTLLPILALLSFALSFFAVSAGASDAGADLQHGDLIFHTSTSAQANAILLASRSPFSHVGIIAVRGTQRFVVEAINPVSETPLASWIARGRGARYAVYRDSQLDASKRQALVDAARVYLGRRYDPFFTFANNEIYCSELVWLAYQSLGLARGKIERVKELEINNAAVQALVQQRWRMHPLCQTLPDFASCWSVILEDQLITPASLANDSRLKLVFSNY